MALGPGAAAAAELGCPWTKLGWLLPSLCAGGWAAGPSGSSSGAGVAPPDPHARKVGPGSTTAAGTEKLWGKASFCSSFRLKRGTAGSWDAKQCWEQCECFPCSGNGAPSPALSFQSVPHSGGLPVRRLPIHTGVNGHEPGVWHWGCWTPCLPGEAAYLTHETAASIWDCSCCRRP